MFEIIIILLAGIGAGIVTGLVGASAVMITAPLLIVFLDYPAYLAIGISLTIDVFASLSATFVYRKYDRVRIKPGLVLILSALIAVIIGSYFSINISSENLGLATGMGIILAGISVILKKKNRGLNKKQFLFLEKYKIAVLIFFGLLIGAIAGFFGAGGGIMVFLVLVLILQYKTHEAIGTAIFFEIFIAFTGGLAHYFYMPFSLYLLTIGAIGGIFGSVATSKIANLLDEKTLSWIVGLTIITLGILLVLKNLFI